jgi:hypothetical protein
MRRERIQLKIEAHRNAEEARTGALASFTAAITSSTFSGNTMAFG